VLHEKHQDFGFSMIVLDLGGSFGSGQIANLARLEKDGGLDQSFQGKPNWAVNEIVQDAENRILLGGFFFEINRIASDKIGRLLETGERDVDFLVGSGIDGYYPREVYAMALDGAHRIVVTGHFQGYDGMPHFGIARLFAQSTDENIVPALAIRRLDDNVIISWPVSSNVFALQMNSELSTAGWVDVMEEPKVVGIENNLVLSAKRDKLFYRLRR